MALYIPGTSFLFDSGLDNLVQHIRTNSVVVNCQVIPHAVPDMGVRVTAGTIQGAGVDVAVAQTDLVVNANASGQQRWDLVSVNFTTGVPVITQGNPAANPKPPAMPAQSIALGIVAVAPAAVNIQGANIEDRRLFAQTSARFQGFVTIGTSPSTQGALRLPSGNANRLSFRNNANGGEGASLENNTVDEAAIRVGGVLVGAFGAGAGAPYLAIGSPAAGAGQIRLYSQGPVVYRNAANSGNLHTLNTDSSDNLYVGVANDGVSNVHPSVRFGSPDYWFGNIRTSIFGRADRLPIYFIPGQTGLEATTTGTGTLVNGESTVIRVNMNTGATSGSTVGGRLILGAANSETGPAGVGKVRIWQFWFHNQQGEADSNYGYRIFITDENVTTVPSLTAKHIGIRRSLGGSAVFSTADGTTEQTTAITVAATTQHFFSIYYDGTTARCYQDGVLVATHSTNVPATTANTVPDLRLWLENNAAANKQMLVGQSTVLFSS